MVPNYFCKLKYLSTLTFCTGRWPIINTGDTFNLCGKDISFNFTVDLYIYFPTSNKMAIIRFLADLFWISQDTNVGFCCLLCHHLLLSSAKNGKKIRVRSRVTCKLAIIGPRPVHRLKCRTAIDCKLLVILVRPFLLISLLIYIFIFPHLTRWR
jgi:hypothetical protein